MMTSDYRNILYLAVNLHQGSDFCGWASAYGLSNTDDGTIQ